VGILVIGVDIWFRREPCCVKSSGNDISTSAKGILEAASKGNVAFKKTGVAGAGNMECVT